MKFYLSSYKFGNRLEELKKLIPVNKKTAYIANALDASEGEKWYQDFTSFDVAELEKIGLNVQRFDLRNYFHNQIKLEKDLQEYGVLWVSGGNVFVLRQAMKLSGFDDLLTKFAKENHDLLYAGYSAGICVLARSLHGLELVDDPTKHPYKNEEEIIWEGLNLIDYAIVPHYKSDHPESKLVDQVVEQYEKDGTQYKTLCDGEVIIIENMIK